MIDWLYRAVDAGKGLDEFVLHHQPSNAVEHLSLLDEQVGHSIGDFGVGAHVHARWLYGVSVIVRKRLYICICRVYYFM